jgi:hypothetical protein
MNKLKLLALGAAFAATSGAANAAVYYADEVISANYGTCTRAELCNANDRQNTDNALGAPDGSFYSLGFGGDLTVGFAKDLFEGIKKVVTFEITFGSVPAANHFEAVDVYSVLGDVTTLLGRITNESGGGSVTSAGAFQYIKLVDATRDQYPGGTRSYDGFDVDSVSIAPVPLPAAGGMLLLGVAGMAALRRRNKAA